MQRHRGLHCVLYLVLKRSVWVFSNSFSVERHRTVGSVRCHRCRSQSMPCKLSDGFFFGLCVTTVPACSPSISSLCVSVCVCASAHHVIALWNSWVGFTFLVESFLRFFNDSFALLGSSWSEHATAWLGVSLDFRKWRQCSAGKKNGVRWIFDKTKQVHEYVMECGEIIALSQLSSFHNRLKQKWSLKIQFNQTLSSAAEFCLCDWLLPGCSSKSQDFFIKLNLFRLHHVVLLGTLWGRWAATAGKCDSTDAGVCHSVGRPAALVQTEWSYNLIQTFTVSRGRIPDFSSSAIISSSF